MADQPDPTPAPPSPEAERLAALLDELFGPGAVARLRRLIAPRATLLGANPDIISPRDGANIAAATDLRVVCTTDDITLLYDVLLFQLPDMTNPIHSFTDVQGAPRFEVTFPGHLFVAGEDYAVKVQVAGNPPGNGTDTHTYHCV
ncbi:MAG: hypothetical protein C0501_03550 [Isosphaera sp.]|nr:hypothetical protein [Isosphaera sp.]